MAMRKLAGILVATAAIGFSAVPLARAQEQNDSSPSPTGHVQQHQQLVPQNDSKDSDQSARDQSAQAPKSPSVITPPSTGDKSVITPPATGMAKTPVIKPNSRAQNRAAALPYRTDPL
jgi:hypothetical protein